MIAKVDGMAHKVSGIHFVAFDPGHAGEWMQVMAEFKSSLISSQKAAQEVVDTSFRQGFTQKSSPYGSWHHFTPTWVLALCQGRIEMGLWPPTKLRFFLAKNGPLGEVHDP